MRKDVIHIAFYRLYCIHPSKQYLMRKILPTILLSTLLSPALTQAQQTWIVGGSSVQQGQLPWLGDLRQTSPDEHLCGISLIDANWAITAAHCLFDPWSGDPADTSSLRIRFNSIRTNGPLNPSGGVHSLIQTIFIHPFFMGDIREGYDIGLLRLRQPVTTIAPIKLPSAADAATLYNTGNPVKIAGWGIMDTVTYATPDTLKMCTAKVYDFVTCSGQFPPGLSNRVFCAGYKSTEPQGGAAAGDSGGPVWVENGGEKKIVGLVSGGNGPFTAPDEPGLFTKVAIYRPWIDSVVKANGGYTPTASAGNTPWNDDDIKIGSDGNTVRLIFGNIGAARVGCSIFNTDGRKVYSTDIAAPSLRVYTIDVSNLPAGLYVIRLFNPDNSQYLSRKMIRG